MDHTAVQAGAYLHHVAFESANPARLAGFYGAAMDMKWRKSLTGNGVVKGRGGG